MVNTYSAATLLQRVHDVLHVGASAEGALVAVTHCDKACLVLGILTDVMCWTPS